MQDHDQKPEFIDRGPIKNAGLVFRALNHDVRQQILNLLHEKQEITVTGIYTAMEREQSEVSQHLAILRKTRVVTSRRDGKQIYYSINYERLRLIEAKAIELG